MKSVALSLMVALATGCASLRAPPPHQSPAFAYRGDTFAYANETVFAYRDGAPVEDRRETAPKYTRRCFVMAAGAVQFWKAARFDPTAPLVSRAELARRIRQVVGRGTWEPVLPAHERVVFPGYRDLWDFSSRETRLLQQNLGPGWTTYFQPHKFSIQCVPSAAHQQRVRAALDQWLGNGQPMVLWLYNFPNVNINHAVALYAKIGPNRFAVYDPNFTDRPRELVYNAPARTFEFEPTFYFPGGPVKVRPVFLHPLH